MRLEVCSDSQELVTANFDHLDFDLAQGEIPTLGRAGAALLAPLLAAAGLWVVRSRSL